MREWKPPSLHSDFEAYLPEPPHPEALLGVAEPVVFLSGNYIDAYATAEAKRRGENREIPSGCMYRFKEHGTMAQMPPSPRTGRHWEKRVSTTCSAGTDFARQECTGCKMVDRGNKTFFAVDRFAFEIFHAGWYHERSYLRNGETARNKEGQPILVRDVCLRLNRENELHRRADERRGGDSKRSRECKGCQQGHPLVFGNRRILKVGQAHKDALLDIGDGVERRCAGCQTMIAEVAYQCAQCAAQMLDLTQVRMGKDELRSFAAQPIRCKHCGHEGLPSAKKVCGYNENYTRFLGGCATTRPLEFTEAMIWLQREGEKAQTQIVATTHQPLSGSVVPALPQGFVSKDLPGSPVEPLILALREAQPWNLAELYAPLSPEEQAKILKVNYPVT